MADQKIRAWHTDETLPNYLNRAREQYPILRDLDIGYVNTPSDNGRILEYWNPEDEGEPHYPRPKELPLGRSGIQVFDANRMRPIDALGDVVSHELVNTNPQLEGLYEEFKSQLDPQMMHDRYQYHKEHLGEDRPYNQWYEATGLPEMFRGYTFDQWPDSKNMYRADQLETLNKMRKALGIDKAEGGEVSADGGDVPTDEKRFFTPRNDAITDHSRTGDFLRPLFGDRNPVAEMYDLVAPATETKSDRPMRYRVLDTIGAVANLPVRMATLGNYNTADLVQGLTGRDYPAVRESEARFYENNQPLMRPLQAMGEALPFGIKGLGYAPVLRPPIPDREAVTDAMLRFAADESGSVPLGKLPKKKTSKNELPSINEIKQKSSLPQEATRGILATPDLRNLSTEEAIAAARNEPHLIMGKEGQYVGAPRGVSTRKQIEEMRAGFDKDVAEGAIGADWYERARKFNVESQGNDPAKQRLAAGEQALWSAQANPDTNLGFALNARNNYEAGHPLNKVRTGAQALNYNTARDKAMDAIENARGRIGDNGGPPLDDILDLGFPKLGKKTGIYGQHLDPTVPYATTGTNDIWHARGFGYTNNDGGTFSRALTPQEHRFLDYETMLAVDRANATKLGGRDNWTAAEIQAAPWVAGKGRAVGIEEAAKTYPDYAPKYTVNVTSEQIPGKATGILPQLIGADDATKSAFHNAASWTDSMGRDRLLDELNLSTLPDRKGIGSYINSANQIENNPVNVSRPMTGFEPNNQGNPEIPQFMQHTLNAVQGVRGWIDAQEGSPWNKVITHGGGGDKSSLAINIERMPTKAEMNALGTVARKYGFDLANADNGVSFLNFSKDTGKDVAKKLKTGLETDIKAILPDASIERGRLNSGYYDLMTKKGREYSIENAGKGKATKTIMGTLDALKKTNPGYYDKLIESEIIPQKAAENLKRLSDYGGIGQRPDYDELLNLLREGGIEGVKERIAKFGYSGLPAVVGGLAIAPGLLGSSDSNKN